MRLLVDSTEVASRRSVELSISAPGATVSDLARALSLPPAALTIDGFVRLGDVLLSDVSLVEGSRVAPVGPSHASRSGIGHSWVGISAGPEAGSLRRLDSHGAVTIGRSAHSDLSIANSSVSDLHAVIERTGDGVTIEDLDSTNGTWLDGRAISRKRRLNVGDRARVGSSTITHIIVERGDKPLGTTVDHADVSGRILFNRPPRSPVAEPPAIVDLPAVIPARQNPKLAIAAILIPLLLAAVMVVVLGSWRFALFALLSPLMALTTWISGRRAVKKATAGDVSSRKEAVQEFNQKLGDAEREERQRRAELGPDLLEVRRRVELPSSRLWERRLGSADALTFRVGRGSTPWKPTGNERVEEGRCDEEIRRALDASCELDNVELLAQVRTGPVGFVGDAGVAAAAVRSATIQLATHHGPADMSIVILTEESRKESWTWAQWLPHTTNKFGGVDLVTGTNSRDLAAALDRQLETGDSNRTTGLGPGVLLIVDDLALLHERNSPVRSLLERAEQNVFGLVLAEVDDQLPASVQTIVELDASDGEFTKIEPGMPGRTEYGIADAIPIQVAEDIARAMAKFEDPEVPLHSAVLPRRVAANDIIDKAYFDRAGGADHLGEVWKANSAQPTLSAPVGICDEGVLTIDLVRDGPHGLVAGTTGSGKSEFLRSLVLGLACNYSPDDLVFVLIDYKGGSAFDRCAQLPHVAGLVTDLDDHLAERALESLEAELRHRESILRDSHADNIDEYRAAGSPSGVLPRLVVVIDEFATMRAELDGFVGSLVGIAQRGRSLGVHLILATQRPAGAVDANIAANTNLRVALRVQSSGDSVDVIGDGQAATIARDLPGRCVVRRGDDDLVRAQTAFVSGAVAASDAPLRVGEFDVGAAGPTFAADTSDVETTHIDVLVEACHLAAADLEPVRSPWLPDLPSRIADLSGVESVDPTDGSHVALAVADDPSCQRRLLVGWNLDTGNLGFIGRSGSGVTTAVRSAVVALGAENDRPVWVFPVDHGAGGLNGLDRFDHVAPVISGNDGERQERLLQFLGATLDERLAGADASNAPLIVLAIDGIASFCERNKVDASSPNAELVKRLGRDGPLVGIHLVVGAGSRAELPRELRQSVTFLVVLEQADERAYIDLGIQTKTLPSFQPGRCLIGPQSLVSQIIDWEAIVDGGEIKLRRGDEPPEITPLRRDIAFHELPAPVVGADLCLPVGICDTTRGAAELVIRSAEHALIVGPSGSGKSNALAVIGAQLRRCSSELVLVGIGPDGSTSAFSPEVFDAAGSLEDLADILRLATDDGPSGRNWVVMVDDADRIDDDGGVLDQLARCRRPDVTLIAAIGSSFARQSFGHWTRLIRASGTGLLLEPDPVVDGDVFGVRLPRQRLARIPGRGYLIAGGEQHVVQLAMSDEMNDSANVFFPSLQEEE